MALFKSLLPYAQQFFVDGMNYVLLPGEVKELPDSFRERYRGLVEEIVPLKKVKKVEEIVPEVPSEMDGPTLGEVLETKLDSAILEEKDTVLEAVTKANSEVVQKKTPSAKKPKTATTAKKEE